MARNETIANFNLVPDKDPSVMAKYMKNKFKFVGVSSASRRNQSKPIFDFIKTVKPAEAKNIVADLFDRPEREYQYVAIDAAGKFLKHWRYDDIIWLSQYVTMKSWWDSVDPLRKIFADYVILHEEYKHDVFHLFYGSENFWDRRIAINLQLMAKQKTDLHLLTQAIEYDINTNEFFIQKAIGWSLRDYAKTDATWVKNYLATHKLSKLAVREASKHL